MTVKSCEKLEKSRVALTIETSAEEFEAAVNKAYLKMRGKINVPGFRVGKAPRKIILKGNHDYWWNTASKMQRFFADNGLDSIEILHNNCLFYNGTALCGTRGWFYELDNEGTHNGKMLAREAGRLETSLKAAGDAEKICFLHYPPLYQGYECPEILRLLQRYGVKECYFGHLHGAAQKRALEGRHYNTEFHLVAADYLDFTPVKICD